MIFDARKIVDQAISKGAEHSEAFILKEYGEMITIEKDSITSATGSLSRGIGIRVIKDNRIGFAFCTEFDKADKAIEQALSLSKLSEPSSFEFASPSKFEKIEKTFDNRIVNLTHREGLEYAQSAIDGALGIEKDIIMTRGGLGYGYSSYAIANSNGFEIEEGGTSIFGYASTVLKKGSVSTGYESMFSRTLDLDFESLGKMSAELTVRSQNAKKVEGGVMSAVFTPNAIAEMLEFVTAPALYGEQAMKGESVYSGKVGEVVTSKDISIIDDGILPGGMNTASTDDEGTPSKRVELVKKGVLKEFMYDIDSATKFDAESTGNGLRCERWATSRSYKAPPKTVCRNLIIEGNSKKVDDIISEVENGVLVHELLGAHTSNPASGDFSVNSSSLFKIEKGEIAYPVKSAMLSGNLPECLKKVKGIGDDYKHKTGGLSPVGFYIPTVCLDGVTVTG